MSELTFEEFCKAPLTYTFGMTGDWGAHRAYRNKDLGIQKETVTKRKRYGDIYSGWQKPDVAYYLDRDPREFHSVADLYVAWMHKVCGVPEEATGGAV
jgi:hypothetical protein